MLYDTRWDAKVKTEPSLERFIRWLEGYPPKKRYNFLNCQGGCLVGLYMKAEGIPWDVGTYQKFAYSFLRSPTGETIASQLPCTFGGALKRARAALARTKGQGPS